MDTVSDSVEEVSISNNTETNILTVNIPKGRWFIEGICTFKPSENKAYATYVTILNVTDNPTEVAGPPDAWGVVHAYGIVYFATTTTITLRVRHRYGSTIPCVGTLIAKKLA